jgi:hypothetical protein
MTRPHRDASAGEVNRAEIPAAAAARYLPLGGGEWIFTILAERFSER